MGTAEEIPRQVAERALDLLGEVKVIGLGTGKAASAFIRALGDRLKKQGGGIRGVPTSEASARLATSLDIPLATLDDVESIDVTVDGADAVERGTLHLLKGLGGVLVREKVVASASRRLLVVVTESTKIASGRLGSGPPTNIVPVEVVPFALSFCRRRLHALGLQPSPRVDPSGNGLYRTDNGNVILDGHLTPTEEPEALDAAIRAIPGVVGTGLFLGMAEAVIAPIDGRIEILRRDS